MDSSEESQGTSAYSLFRLDAGDRIGRCVAAEQSVVNECDGCCVELCLLGS